MTEQKIISAPEYEIYHPGTLQQSSKEKGWKGLLLATYTNPLSSNEGSPRPSTNDHLLMYINEGSLQGEYSLNDEPWKPYRCNQHQWAIGPAYQNGHDSRWKPGQEDMQALTVSYLHLDPQVLSRHALEALDEVPEHIELIHKIGFDDPLMLQLALTLQNEAEKNTVYEQIYVQSAASLLSIHLLKNYCSISYKVPEYSQKPSKLSSVLEYIDTHIKEDLSIETLANITNMSVYHFIRTFKATMGMAPHKYVVQVRIDKAKRTLQETNMSIAEIANTLGYSVSHFTYLFRKSTGCTPRKYREQNRNYTLYA